MVALQVPTVQHVFDVMVFKRGPAAAVCQPVAELLPRVVAYAWHAQDKFFSYTLESFHMPAKHRNPSLLRGPAALTGSGKGSLHRQRPGQPPVNAEGYFRFLQTPYKCDDGEVRQPAAAAFVEVLREVHGCHVPLWDLGACLDGTAAGFSGKVWFWSDLHLSHANIIKYCQRPFADTAAMNSYLIRRCLAKVSAGDILVFGGDIAFGDIGSANAFLRRIPAYKLLVLGNHDVNKRTILPLEFDEIAACLEFSHAGVDYFLSHYPVPEGLLGPRQVSLHGHLHNTRLPQSLGTGLRHANMSVEGLLFEPRALPEIASAIRLSE